MSQDNQGVAATPPLCGPTGGAAEASPAKPAAANAGGKWATIRLKVPREFHDRIGAAAKRQDRTMTAEIMARLEPYYLPGE